MKKKSLISFGVTLVVGMIYFYFFLPPIHPQSFDFWIFVGVLLLVFLSLNTEMSALSSNQHFNTINLSSKVIIGGIVFIVLGLLFTNFVLSPLFMSQAYQKRITVLEDGDFAKDIEEINYRRLPLIDKESSEKLGDRVMGQMPEMVSQYRVSNLYTQINYQDTILRVTPLEYNGFFKYLKNHKKGITGYIKVDSVSGESALVKLEEGMKYVPSSYFFKNLKRHLRFRYPTFIFGNFNFEIDNEGQPYFVVPVLKYAGVQLRKDVKGVVLLDPITGESVYYDVLEVPTWVDHVYDADLIIEQVDDWGIYKNGFLNSIFSQTNVVKTTEGYNYTVLNDDVYLYTGITSVSSDEANIGFIMTNLRTKGTKFYQVPGAEEYSAMASAEGQVQQMNYNATFPLLINLNGKPTYLMSLKDHAGLVKMYALVDVHDYQNVLVSESSLGIEAIVSKYLENETVSTENFKTRELTIKFLKEVLIDGTTYYYLIDQDNKKYSVSIKVNKNQLPFMKIGDKIRIYYKEESDLIEIRDVDF